MIGAHAAKYIFLTCIVSGVMILDQGTKSIVQQRMELYQSIPVIENFFSLTYVRNPGAAFGFLSEQAAHLRAVFFSVTSSVALIALAYFYITSQVADRLTHMGLALVMGGAIGNLLDRIRLGAVVDFLDFYAGRYHWPAFNVADSAITIGIAILIVHSFWTRRGPVSVARETPAPD